VEHDAVDDALVVAPGPVQRVVVVEHHDAVAQHDDRVAPGDGGVLEDHIGLQAAADAGHRLGQLELQPVLRAAADLRAEADPPAGPSPDETEFRDLAADCATRLRDQLDRPQREPGDWSVPLPAGGCTCDLCAALRDFLAAPDQRTLEWPLAKQRRQHVHTRIDAAEVPVTHVTKRQGSPYVLVLRKTDDLFTREQKARSQADSDLKWLANEWDLAI